MFGAATHLLWLLFWVSTGLLHHQPAHLTYLSFSLGIEAIVLFNSITSVVQGHRMFYLVLGFGLSLPTSLVIALLTYSLLTGAEVYLRRYPEVGTQSRTYITWYASGIRSILNMVRQWYVFSITPILPQRSICPVLHA